jgi:ribosomal protein L20A (L18A)
MIKTPKSQRYSVKITQIFSLKKEDLDFNKLRRFLAFKIMLKCRVQN